MCGLPGLAGAGSRKGTPRQWWFAAALALAAIAVHVAILSSTNQEFDELAAGAGSDAGPGRRLLVSALLQRSKWDAKRIAGLVLSVVVSLSSSLDRECGASLYMVLFAVLLDLPFRRAAALTAFTVALGALAPGIAAMSEPHITERGILALVDYPGALVLLPCMFWGLSFGVIVNLAFPNWLLALMWVVIVAASTAELAWSFGRHLQNRKQARLVGRKMRLLEQERLSSAGGAAGSSGGGGQGAAPAASGAGSDAASLPDTVAVLTSAGVHQKRQRASAAASSGSSQALVEGESMAQLQAQARRLHAREQQIEAVALVYPAFHVPALEDIFEAADLPAGGLRANATPSCLTAMDAEEVALTAELQAQRLGCSRYVLRWKAWWRLNNRFELSLVLKIVVLHLVTEAVRHYTAKPCTSRFWVMLCVVTGMVTAFLLFVVTSYSQRRLWRGPHWADALQQCRQLKKQQALQAAALGGAGSRNADAIAAGAHDNGSCALPAAPAGEAVAIELVTAAGPEAMLAGAAASSASDARQPDQVAATAQPAPGRWARIKARLPWTWVPACEAVTNISACNSYNSWRRWQVPTILACAAATQVIGTVGCALGLPAGPMMAWLLLALGLKPAVVAGTSRFLVLCFCFGSFVAHNVAGGLPASLAAAFGLLNLGLAPLGMLLLQRARLRLAAVLAISLCMGLAGMLAVLLWQLVPLLAHLALSHGAYVTLPEALVGVNSFDLQRFCKAHH